MGRGCSPDFARQDRPEFCDGLSRLHGDSNPTPCSPRPADDVPGASKKHRKRFRFGRDDC
jgi:hypothetical protein